MLMKIFVNGITTFRFLYTLFLPIIKSKASNTFFIINIILLFLTDSIDGTLARKHNVQTIYGSGMDTIADKTLSIVLLFMLAEKIPVLSLVLILEVIIFLISISAIFCNKKIRVGLFGKTKMWLLAATIVLSYMNYFGIINYNVVLGVGMITIILQLLTTFEYISGILIKTENKLDVPKIKSFNELIYILFDTEYYKMLYN